MPKQEVIELLELCVSNCKESVEGLEELKLQNDFEYGALYGFTEALSIVKRLDM